MNDFRKYMLISVCVHMALLLVMWVGLPSISRDYTPPKKAVDVALISEKDLKRLGKKSKTLLKNTKTATKRKVTPNKGKAEKPKPKPKPKPTPKPTPKVEKLPDLAKKKADAQTKEKINPVHKQGEKLPTFNKKKQAPKTDQKPKEQPKEDPKPQPKPEPVKEEPQKEEQKEQPEIKEQPKKDEPEQESKPEPKKPKLESALKNLEALKSQAITNNKNRRAIAGISDDDKGRIQKAQQTRLADKIARSGTANGQLSSGEMDALRQQIANAWSVPIGVRGIEDMQVEINVRVNSDKTIQSVKLLNSLGMNASERAFAESALRAVKKVGTLDLPDGKYSEWHSITFTFNAREMLGY